VLAFVHIGGQKSPRAERAGLAGTLAGSTHDVGSGIGRRDRATTPGEKDREKEKTHVSSARQREEELTISSPRGSIVVVLAGTPVKPAAPATDPIVIWGTTYDIHVRVQNE